MAMKRRLMLLALVLLGVAPGTLVRDPPIKPDLRPILEFSELAAAPRGIAGGLEVEGIWQLTSPRSDFGGYSGLVALSDDELLAVSDQGAWVRFRAPPLPPSPVFGALARVTSGDKRQVDAEALTFDPGTQRIWIAYEGTNAIERSDLAMAGVVRGQPKAMANWSDNSGAEAMTRLTDGRFIVLGEGSPEWFGRGKPGLLFDGDPIARKEPLQFGFETPEGFSPTDMAALPDGRVMVLLRSVASYLPPRFGTKIAIADPATIAAGEPWANTVIATIPASLPRDNFEGLAAVPNGDGSVTLWLISDDNRALFQRTLLYRLRWSPSARGTG